MHPDQKTLEELNAPKPYAEYPKMLHHPDGSTRIVNGADEEKAAGDEWQQTPQDAIDLKAARDEIAKKAQEKAIADALAASEADKAKKGAK